ncbi:MAG TPA: chloride channel protein [Trebonia sp.]|nr:chloride channel protein [Trebonia sp.]
MPRWRRVTSVAGARVNALSYLPKWLILAAVIGAIAGLGAIVFYAALQGATHLFLGTLAGYAPPTPAGEGGAAGTGHYARPWAIPLVVILGGLIAGFIVFTWAPEAEGHGTDAAIDAVHHNPRGIRLRAVIVKIIASAVTIGSGGSGGREGPTAQISAGFGSLLARVLNLSPEDGRIAVSVGIGSGIGSIFGAPLGGAVLASDIVYKDDFEFSALLPGTFASVIAWAIFGGVYGYRPLFAIPGYHFDHPVQLLWFAIIGLLAGGIGLLYSKVFYGVAALSRRLPLSRRFRPAVGAALVGLLALWLPEVLGTGYGWVQQGLANQLLHTPLYIVLLLPFARIVATALSIGTGGSGGVFGPGMVIGAFTGLAVWRLLEPIAPGVGHSPAAFVVVGMMAVFGGISRAPIAVALMVAEMTGSISLLAPAMVAIAVSWFIVERADDSIYRSQLRSKADSAASRLEAGLPSLSTLKVAQVMSEPRVVIDEQVPGTEALARLRSSGLPGAPVADADGTYLGTVRTSQLDGRPSDGSPARALADGTVSSVAASAGLDVGLAALMDAGGQWLTVTSDDRRVVGILSVADLVRGYRQLIGPHAGRLGPVSRHAVAMDLAVGKHSPLAGQAIRDGGLPPGTVIVTIKRAGENIPVGGGTVIEGGDMLSMFASPGTLDQVTSMVRGPGQPALRAHTEGELV